VLPKYIQGDQKVCLPDDYSTKTSKNILNRFNHNRNVGRAVLSTVVKNTVRCVNKCLETGGGHFEHCL
jgi:hypothetical protein